MAISASTVFEVQSGGSDNNGGGFVTGASGTDYSQQTSAQATLSASSVVNSTTTIIDVAGGDYTCTDNDVGNILQITGGTATAGFYQITARSSQQWTLDRSAGTAAQTVVGAMGGAFASPGQFRSVPTVNGIQCWVKEATYTLTTSTPGSGGPCHLPDCDCRLTGYSSTRGDNAGRPILDAGAQTGVRLFYQIGSKANSIRHMQADGNSGSGNIGFDWFNDRGSAHDCIAIDCPSSGFIRGNPSQCYAQGCGNGFSTAGAGASRTASFCFAKDCTDGFNEMSTFNCIASGCGTGFILGTTFQAANCVAYDSTDRGFEISYNGRKSKAINCISVSNGTYGYFRFEGDNPPLLVNCASYNNTSGRDNGSEDVDAIILTGDPFTDAVNDDFSLNNTAGAGAACRAAGIDVYIQTGFIDVGAVQHEDAGGGGGGVGSGLTRGVLIR